ncbi:SRPBCC family protein [Streptomyces olivochromogenes]|uniref:SRPBCC family protein n=1 Tax=Streptomyces olivochromogenes TaxID=1963 RepID=UPI001F3E0FDC|nr:SRPBCC family protein [Streptomyces olivochromogenes]MCF3131653.1 SRPBCC family protein [Streptomyces olivochromogenes]
MSAFHEEITVDCTPEDVWAYVIDPSHLPEWQLGTVSAEKLDEGDLGLGSLLRVIRHVGTHEVPMTMEVTEYEPPHIWGMRGIDGPVRGLVRGEITPIDGGRRARVSMDLDFEGHGFGKVLLPLLVRPQARKELPRNEQLLKDHLEHTGAAGEQ